MHQRVKDKLEELRSARNKSQGEAILKELFAFDSLRDLPDFAEIVKHPEYADPEYSRKIPWDIRVHVAERWLRRREPQVFDAFRFMLDHPLSWARSTYLKSLARTGRSFALETIEQILLHENSEEDRRAVLQGIDFASKKECQPAFVAGVLDCLAGFLKSADTESREYVLSIVKEFSEERYRELKMEHRPAPEPFDDSHKYYRLQPSDPCWGDYGRVLIHGVSWLDDLDEETGRLVLQRTGPFVPPITFPSPADIVVTSDFRDRWQARGFTGAEFQPVIVRKLVRIPWETWDRESSAPEKLPAGGEPENYLLRRKDNRALHQQIGELWNLVPKQAQRKTGSDIFALKAKTIGKHVIVSQQTARWLMETAPDWITLTPAD